MKRAAAALLSIVFQFNCAGCQCIFLWQQKRMHEQNWNNKENENSFTVRGENSALIMNGHELLVDGKLCDIISVKKTAHGIEYVCKEDAKENALVAEFVKSNSDV